MDTQIAIIGMAGRFPGARTIDELHQLLRQGRVTIAPITPQRLADTTLPADGNYHRRGYMDGIDRFDPAAFGLSMAEAQTMDPHQRLLLEVVQETIENAGYAPDQLKDTNTAVLATDSKLVYYQHADTFEPTLVTGNGSEFLAARINRTFGLSGSVSVINTSCSSGMVALHHACNELITGSADMAIVCGANLELFPDKADDAYHLDIESADGLSVPFSDRANGMVFGEVVAGLLLKPLAAALRDGDVVQAVILSTAVNNNGHRAASLTAPDSTAQAEVILRAWQRANIDPTQLQFIEAHGSGTLLGDTLEMGGFDLAFRKYTDQPHQCAISSIKGNIGHGRSAAGLSGVIKAVLALREGELYPAITTGAPLPYVNHQAASVYVNAEGKTLASGEQPLIGAVSSIGFSGTNCHAVLQQPPVQAPAPITATAWVIALSGRRADLLRRNVQNLRQALSQLTDADLPNLSYTLAKGRQWHSARLVLTVSTLDELASQLDTYLANPLAEAEIASTPKVIYLFSETISGSPIASFLHQLAQADQLTDLGLTADRMLGVGLGKVVADVAAGKRAASEAETSIRAYQAEAIPNVAGRVNDLLAREANGQPVLFVTLGEPSQIAEAICQHPLFGHTVTVTQAPAVNAPARARLDWLGTYLTRGLPLNWDRHFAGQSVRRMSLPASAFDPKRCWLRTEPRAKATTTASPAPVHYLTEPGATPTQQAVAAIWAEVLNTDQLALTDNFFAIGGTSLRASKVIQRVNQQYALHLDFEDMFDYPTLAAFCQLIEPEADLTTQLTQIWVDVLKQDTVRPTDNFFELGGHSLLANRILNRIQALTGVGIDFDAFFKAPTIAELVDLVEARRQQASSGGQQAIERIADQPYYDLSNAQKRLWLLSQLEESSVAYNEFLSYRLDGPVDIDALNRAFGAVVARHDSLRTVYDVIDDDVKQRVLSVDEHGFAVDVIYLQTTPDAEDMAWAMANQLAREPFNLKTGPVIWVKLLKMSDTSHVLLINIHHIAFDEWSMKVFLTDLFTAYSQYALGHNAPLPATPVRYVDYVAWHQAQLNSDRLADSRAYWLDQLQGELPTLELPADLYSPGNRTYLGDISTLTLNRAQTEALQALCRQQGVSMYMLLLATVNSLLYRYTGQTDIIVGAPVAGRTHLQLEELVGFFVNTVALRTQLDGQLTFDKLLQRVKAGVLGAYEHQQYPFDQLVDDLKLPRGLDESPLFNVLVVYDKANWKALMQGGFNGIRFQEYGARRGTAKFDLDFTFHEEQDSLTLTLGYSTDRFSAARINQLLQHFARLTESILTNPLAPLASLTLLSPADVQRQLIDWQGTPQPYPNEATLLSMIEAQVAQTPDRVAVIHGDALLTYGQLNRKANALALCLADRGIGKGDLVPVLMSRGLDFTLAFLAIMKTGGVVAPISKHLPVGKLRELLTDLQPQLILTETSTADLVTDDEPAYVVDYRRIGERTEQPAVTVRPADSLYVIHTSGSTGKPKGVDVPHRGIVNRFGWMNRYFGPATAQSVLRTTKHVYDSSVWQLFWPMVNGGKTVIPLEDRELDMDYLFETIREHAITIVDFVPSLFDEVVQNLAERASQIQSLHHVILGGEAIRINATNRFKAQYPAIRVTNLYGPTEASIGCIAYEVTGTDEERIPIGQPIDNVQVYVLDANRQLLSAGLIGELYLSGICLANGYLNDPQRTADAFVPNPFGGDKHPRMYRTGDLVRWLNGPAGPTLDFVGRTDSQVKIRGHRIELGEIEHVLQQAPGLQEAAVVAIGPDDNRQLVAYVVEKTEAANTLPSPEELTLLDSFSGPEYPLPANETWLNAFVAQAAAYPDRVALVCGERTITYRALDTLTAQLARQLVERGVGPETMLPVACDRSIEWLLLLMGAMRAGGVYIPLALDKPTQLKQTILADCAATYLLTTDVASQQHQLARELPQVTILTLETLLAAPDTNTPLPALTPDQLAYVLFTSGTTGQPKGAMIEHRGMLNHLLAKTHDLHLTPTSRVVQNASMSFDISVWQALVALTVGGQTLIFVDDVVQNPVLFTEQLAHTQPTILEVVPTYLTVLLGIYETSLAKAALPLKYLLVTGETVKKNVIARWFARFPAIPVVNAYGPTECSDDVTHCILTETPADDRISIGRPVLNTTIYILDEQQRRCNLNIPGEICVAGVGVGRGYLNQPEKTGQVFGVDPFATAPMSRLYHTGDLGYYNADGSITFLGRRDTQVKFRGYRIELEDIEYHLTQLDGVENAAVLMLDDATGNQYLHGFVQATASPTLNPSQFKAALAASLPAYMIPGQIEVMEALPLTANGKIDRKVLKKQPVLMPEVQPLTDSSEAFLAALQAHLAHFLPSHMRPAHIIRLDKMPVAVTGKIDRKHLNSLALPVRSLSQTGSTPQTERQQAVAAIWQRVLGREEAIGNEQDFFSLGGHSLTITKLIAAYQRQFGIKLNFRDLFVQTTIAGQATLLDQRTAAARLEAISHVPQAESYPLSSAQRRLWMLHQLDGAQAAYHISGTFWLTGEVDQVAFETAFTALLDRHESLRTTFRLHNGEPRQFVAPATAFPSIVTYLTLNEQPEPAYDTLGTLPADEPPFNLEQDAPIRVRLVRFGATHYQLVFTIHHIVSDEWSMRVLVDEFLTLYAAQTGATQADLTPLPIQYRDFVAWQADQLAGSAGQRAAAYWQQQFATPVPALELPTDAQRPVWQTYRGANYQHRLSPELTRQLRLTSEAGTTLFATMLAGWKGLFHRYTGQTDLVIGTPVAGRDHPDLDRQIGLYINTLPIRTAINPDLGFDALLRSVQQKVIDAYDYQLYPFDRIVADAPRVLDTSRSPLFDVMLVAETSSVSEQQHRFDSFTVEPASTGQTVSKFDLTIYYNTDGDAIDVKLNYNPDLFSEATIEQMARQFDLFLMQALAQPAQPLRQVTYLQPADTDTLWQLAAQPARLSPALRDRLSAEEKPIYAAIPDTNGQLKGIGLEGTLYVSAQPWTPETGLTTFWPTDLLARLLTDRTLALVGETERMIVRKSRRINLMALETALQSLPGVRDGYVAYHHDELIAYVGSTKALTVDALETQLLALLPPYAMPTQFVVVATLPRLANGQINIDELESLSPLAAVAQSEDEQAVAALCEAFTTVLGRETVDADTDFFSEGGDSIKAIQIIAYLYQKGYRLDQKAIFTYPVLGRLASQLSRVGALIEQTPAQGSFPLTPILASFANQPRHNPNHFNQAL
ncbi:amino acid adenylation domain-containing protein, partial [Fibrella sp. WM1]|uniref:amino acid adenylation domain-containing protein n=1 Tax=Fibrella musci TaxID=3242485 RepID=UPI003520C460